MVRLEKFRKDDYDRLIQWVGSEELMIQFAGPAFNFPITNEQLDQYTSAENRLVFRVEDEVSGEVIGHAELNSIDRKNKSARICRILVGDEKNRDKGFGKAIIKELVRIGFEELQLHRLDLGVFDFNHQGIRCYKSCGFEIEGLFRENYKVGDKYWSTYNMSMINKK